MGAKRFTVKDLIEYLQNLPPDAQEAFVALEGCDCTGAWNGETTLEEPTIYAPLPQPAGFIELLLCRDV